MLILDAFLQWPSKIILDWVIEVPGCDMLMIREIIRNTPHKDATAMLSVPVRRHFWSEGNRSGNIVIGFSVLECVLWYYGKG